jgi:hypothetical protein
LPARRAIKVNATEGKKKIARLVKTPKASTLSQHPHNLAMATLTMDCWKRSQFPKTEIVCPRRWSAHAPGHSYATPPTVTSQHARELDAQWTASHQRGRHVPGRVSLAVVVGEFILFGVILGLAFGH